MSGFKLPDKFGSSAEIKEAVEGIANGGSFLEGTWGAGLPLIVSEFRKNYNRPIFIIVPDPEAGDEFEDDMDAWQEKEVYHFPPWDVLPGESSKLEFETLRERIFVLRALNRTRKITAPPVVIAPITTIMQPTINPDDLLKGELTITTGQEIGLTSLCGILADAGLEQVINVDMQGQFSRRGGIVDVYPIFSEHPYRIEFWGDEIDTIQIFDPVTQRNEDKIESAILIDVSTETVMRSYENKDKSGICDHLPENCAVVISEPARCKQMAELYEEGYAESGTKRIFKYNDACKRLSNYPITLATAIKGADWDSKLANGKEHKRIEITQNSLTRLEGSTEHALEQIAEFVDKGLKVSIFSHNAATMSRCREILLEQGEGLASEIELNLGRMSKGFLWESLNWAVISAHEIFHRYKHRPRQKKHKNAGSPIRDFTELKNGDYVVHLMHGIGKYTGMTRLEQNGQENDYLTLLFAEDTKLYVPLSHIELVQKYIGGADARPALSRLGSKSWSKKKAAAEKAVREVAADLLRLQAVRKHSPGIIHPDDEEWQHKFEDEFIFSETEDQLRAISEIKHDMENRAPMDRLLCGDVGFGKTEVAIRAAFKTVMGGHQVAVLVPTTILAEQHYRTFTERTADYPVTVAVLSRFKTAAQQRKIIEKAKDGRIDIVIGTHRLLSSDVAFKNLGLIIVDEEQRFGVEHKEKLKELRTCVDVLTMTATPIPRTLHMGLLGLRDISTLATAPFSRQAIRSQVIRYNEEIIRRAILRELARGGQVYFLHNRVATIESIATKLCRLVPEARFSIGHGQMHEHDLEEVMIRFLEHKTDVLVATTIIESGLDIPNVNTIIINDADRFGLSQLHQLRGRVGRYRNRAYAYFLVPKERPLTPVGRKRLKAIEEFADLGSGFNLAMRDLEIRGAGNIIGFEQSGHIHQVGYELYCRLLDKVVKELNGQKVDELEPVELEIGTHAYLPDEYVNLEEERLKLYRELALCPDESALQAFSDKLIERFGKIPDQVSQLLDDERLRQRARKVGINYIGRLERAIIIGFAKWALPKMPEKLKTYKENRRKLTPLSEERFRFGLGYREEEWKGYHIELLNTAIEVLEGKYKPADTRPLNRYRKGKYLP